MSITRQDLDQAYSDLNKICGGVPQDYFALLYLEREFALERQRAVVQVAFGGNDYGIDAFHFDREKRNLYLFQFKYTESYSQFKASFQRLIDQGMERMFHAQRQDQHQNQLLLQLRSCLLENEKLIDKVCIHFVFTGDPAEAERSQVLDQLREDLENKKYLVDRYFDRQVTLVVEFRSARTHVARPTTHLRKTHRYTIRMEEPLKAAGPKGEQMIVGFVRLTDLHSMYREMGQRFFERNIRAALPPEEAVNRSIQRSLKSIVIDNCEDPRSFLFNHNGVTMSAEAVGQQGTELEVTEPRLLNGAQTVSTLDHFLKFHDNNPALSTGRINLEKVRVMCRVITGASAAFVTSVTVSNNRQNPVDPANLRANDMIQLELQDKLREDLGVYYERQERAFASLSDVDLEEQGITQHRAVELTRLARTFIASDGDIDKLQHFRSVFEDERIYGQVFSKARLNADSRKVLLCYKAQFRLKRLVGAIVERGANKYAFVDKARNLLWALLCQAILNDPDLERSAERFGKGLSVEAQFTEWLASLATTKCRFILSDLAADKLYAAKVSEGNYTFMRTNAAYKRSMEIAYRRWKWVEKRLA